MICITHLPQVASLAARHFRIEKDRRSGAGHRRGRARRRRRAGRRDRPHAGRASAPTRPPAATPASCSRRPERRTAGDFDRAGLTSTAWPPASRRRFASCASRRNEERPRERPDPRDRAPGPQDQGAGQAPGAGRRRGDRPHQHRPDRRRGADRAPACGRCSTPPTPRTAAIRTPGRSCWPGPGSP